MVDNNVSEVNPFIKYTQRPKITTVGMDFKKKGNTIS